MDGIDIPEDVLDEIRRASFETRIDDPQAAVRALRKLAGRGGQAEVLARGALAEVYLDDLGDYDAAEHEFRRVLEMAPGLHAARLGLARVLREEGRFDDAEAGYCAVLDGMQRDLESFRGRELPPGVEEMVLTLLETGLELSALRAERGRPAPFPLDQPLLAWAAQERLFDSEDDPAGDDWERFHGSWARLRHLTGQGGNIAAIDAAQAAGQLEPWQASFVKSRVREDEGDAGAAAEEARRGLEAKLAAGGSWRPDEALRAADLFASTGQQALAADVLRRAGEQIEQARAAGEEADEDGREALRARLEAMGGGLVALGKPKH